MARAKKTQDDKPKRRRLLRPALRWFARKAAWVFGVLGAVFLALTLLGTIIPPYLTPYMISEWHRLGHIERDWTPIEDMAPAMARSVVAAEDANYCLHWGLDLAAIREALDDGAGRGGSTISQQVIKNVFLWQGRSWFRKSLEALMTPVVELVWTKRRILEVYLNLAEFDEGVFGAEAAAQHYFGVTAADLTATQSARLAAILPDPKDRDAANPSDFVRSQARKIISGAETIAVDGRADCFQDNEG